MLRPIIMIGCGGSGQKAVRYVRDSVSRHLEHKGWESGVPKAWQFLGIDTLTTQEDPDIPFLPNNDYVSVSLAFNTYQGLNSAIETKFNPSVNPQAFADLQGWRPNPSQVTVPLKDGAGQLRAVGRTAGILALQESVQKRIEFAFSQCTAGGPELAEVSRHLQVNVPPGTPVPAPLTIIVGSMAGGTGAGIMLDVVDLVRRTDINGAFPVLVAFTPDIFGSIQTEAMTANAAAFMSEMMSAYWDDEATDSALIPSKVAVHTRGPHSIFLIGRKNIDGLDLLESKNVYRAVGEALAAVTTSSTVQTDFHNFITVNWPMAAPANAGGYGFQPSQLKGVASSFGSATISIGRDRFRDYLKKLLHRSIVEHLADGFESVANSVLGENSKSMAGPAKISELNRRNIDRFLVECGLNEVADGNRQVSNNFVSSEIMKGRLAEVSGKIKGPFNPTMQQQAGVWLQTIGAQQQQVKVQVLQAVDAELTTQLREWGTEVLHRVLRTATEFSAVLSMPVVLSLIETTRASVLQSSNLMREESKKAREMAVQSEQKARGHLTANAKGSLQLSAGPVQETISDMSKAIVLEWSAQVKDKLSVALESVATTMLSGLEASISQSLARITDMTKTQDGKPAIVDGWPKNDGVVPASFAPSPVEFFLEEYSNWPDLANKLLSKSLGDPAGLPIDPVEAARLLLIRGGFGGDGKKKESSPLIWSEGHGSSPVWEPGQQVSITIADDFEAMTERIDSWLMRPATELLYVLSEGLSAYLMPTHHKTGAAIPNHQQRISTYRQLLTQALMQSRPLIEVDNVINSTVHPKPLSYTLNIQGFPFGHGHPAREVTESIIQGFMNTAAGVDWAFSSGDAESVLITNFLEYPVHPSVVNSFTQPLNKALAKFDADLLRSSFWQWRRARILENFIPLPDALRIAAIRGFAVARALGVVTADPLGENKISTIGKVHSFPKNLLTETDQSNILPVLLEAMILAFADAPIKGKAAFDAYGALIEYGTGGGMAAGFEIAGETARILSTGDYGNTQILDQSRASALAAGSGNRVTEAIKYIEANIARYDGLDALPLDNRSWRNQVGSVEPVDTMTREMISDLRKAYVQVKDALKRFEQGSDGTGTSVV
jgi:hypothetical protein